MSGALFNRFLFATLHLFYHRHSISMESLSSTENQRSAWNQVTSVVGTETSHLDAVPPVGLGSFGSNAQYNSRRSTFATSQVRPVRLTARLYW